jgi:hypothetical protein
LLPNRDSMDALAHEVCFHSFQNEKRQLPPPDATQRQTWQLTESESQDFNQLTSNPVSGSKEYR